MIRRYSELIRLPTIQERYEYLKLDGAVGEATFGFDRYLNQKFYTSKEWRRFRDAIIVRDNGCELAMPDEDYSIRGLIIIHHMNPVTVDDIVKKLDIIMDPEYVVCVSDRVHRAIHYGDISALPKTKFVERVPGDTCLWR